MKLYNWDIYFTCNYSIHESIVEYRVSKIINKFDKNLEQTQSSPKTTD